MIEEGALLDTIFWGKYRQDGASLSLTAHCLDVAMVFRALCEVDGFRRSLSRAAKGCLTSEQCDRLAVLAMLHDAGKANLGFQLKVFDPHRPQAGHIREFAPILDPEVRDETLLDRFLAALPSGFSRWFSDDVSAYSYLLATLSHHGRPVQFQGERSGTYWQARTKWWRSNGIWDPMEAIAEISRWSERAFPSAFASEVAPLPANPAFHHRFAGLLMLADWLGSHSDWFPVERVDLEQRMYQNAARIPALLESVGIDVSRQRAVLAGAPSTFAGRFGRRPRPLQAMVDELDPDDPSTNLLIAESETGSGKTEAALNWFFTLFATGKVDSLYFALPTRVAARELYYRVNATIERWFPDPHTRPVTVLAVPGYTMIDGSLVGRILPHPEEANQWQDEADLRRRERQWAAEHPKRFLAATVAVGTIDQALLSIVQTAHAHLRSVCLDRGLLVVDEVHASDRYMTNLLERLLRHHLSAGGRAMLLSATLGSDARSRYISAAVRKRVSPPELATAIETPYPSITLANGSIHGTNTSGGIKEVIFEETPLAFDLDAICGHIVQALHCGARVLVVLNTVDRANSLVRYLERQGLIDPSWMFNCHDTPCPHHGRFAPADRLVLDAEVSRRLGPGSPAGPILLVGTQTVEQSLDIDADFLISDLAPADVILQRVGRLHRHTRPRPNGYECPRCLIVTPGHSLESAIDERGHVLPRFNLDFSA